MSGKYILIRFFKEFISPHLKLISLAIVLMIGGAIAGSASAYLAQPVVDKVFVNKDVVKLWTLCGVILASFVAKTFCSYWQQICLTLIETKVVSNLQQALFNKVIHFDISHFDKNSMGSILSHFITDIENVRKALSMIILNIGRDVFTVICLVGIMFYQSWILAIFSFIGLPLVLMPIAKISRKLRRFASLTKVENDSLVSHLNDNFTGIRIIKAYNGEKAEIKTFNKITDFIAKLSFKAVKKSALSSPLMEMCASCAIIITLAYGGLEVINGKMTAGSFFSFMAALIMASRPARGLGGTNLLLQNAIVALDKIYNTLDSKINIESNHSWQKTPSFENAIIDFKNVDFSYSDNSAIDQVIIKNFNLSIKSSSQVAIVGSSGGGKSTIVSLLLRFYDVSAGSVEINGCNVKDIQIDYLRKNIAYVGQESFIFEDSIKNNILYGLENITNEKLMQAINEAGAEFIYKTHLGLDTPVKQSGALSGGQKQLISIVRAMLKNAPILILDEATSSLDNTSEREVKQALEKLVKGKTTIIIAHRLSTIIHCDQIHVINDGKIVESGSHDDLLAREKFYYQLWSAQGI